MFLLHIDHHNVKIFVLSNILLPPSPPFNVPEETQSRMGEARSPWQVQPCVHQSDVFLLSDCCSSSALVSLQGSRNIV